MKLYVLDLGKIVMKGANPVLDEPDAEAAIPIHAFLLDTPEGCILFDAGCHPKAMEGAWPPELCGNPYVTGPGENLPERLRVLTAGLRKIRHPVQQIARPRETRA